MFNQTYLAVACDCWLLLFTVHLWEKSVSIIAVIPLDAIRSLLGISFSRLNKPSSFSHSSQLIRCSHLPTLLAPNLDLLWFTHIWFVLEKLITYSIFCQAEGSDHYPQSPGCLLSNSAQSIFSLRCHKGTWQTCSICCPRGSPGFFCWAASSLASPQPLLMHELVPEQAFAYCLCSTIWNLLNLT